MARRPSTTKPAAHLAGANSQAGAGADPSAPGAAQPGSAGASVSGQVGADASASGEGESSFQSGSSSNDTERQSDFGGGVGDDTLLGTAGDDSLAGAAGAGSYTILSGEGNDAIVARICPTCGALQEVIGAGGAPHDLGTPIGGFDGEFVEVEAKTRDGSNFRRAGVLWTGKPSTHLVARELLVRIEAERNLIVLSIGGDE